MLFVKNKPSIYDEPIDKVLEEMKTMDLASAKYPEMLSYLERLTRLQEENKRDRISPDVMATVLGNLLGILIIVGYEQKHVIVSKGLNFVRPIN